MMERSYYVSWANPYPDSKTLEDIREYEEMCFYDIAVEYFLEDGEHTIWFPPPVNGWRIASVRYRNSPWDGRRYSLWKIVNGKYFPVCTYSDYGRDEEAYAYWKEEK